MSSNGSVYRQLRSVGGVTSISRSSETFCFPNLYVAENGLCGLSLRTTIILLSLFDLLLGLFYIQTFYTEIYSQWKSISSSGYHYFITTLFLIRILAIVFALIGFYASNKMSSSAGKAYYRAKIFEFWIIPLVGLLSIRDMCKNEFYLTS